MEATYVYDDASHFAHSCALLTSRSTGKERDSESGNEYSKRATTVHQWGECFRPIQSVAI